MEKLLGSKFGPYEIVAALGAGGMGEVYRAKDTRLKREVAIKILSGQDVIDPEREQRFQREAQAASALNHPNILVVHDVGRENGTSYIVSELVDGESLRKVIDKGQQSVKYLLDVAVQIADGLSAAHQAGITHRDLKPENIMVNRNNRVKILDFGLAKLRTSEIGNEDDITVSRNISQTGIIRGTVSYMSPEQASGKHIDFRSDQFSFGLILYEMATGKKAFIRNSPAETLSAIINEEPVAISSMNSKIPLPLRWLTERCLAKDPRQRYDSTLDLYHELRNLRDHLSETTSPLEVTTFRQISRPIRLSHIMMMGTILLSLLYLAFFVGRKTAVVEEAVEKPLPMYQQLTFRRGNINSARFTPDGNTVIYSAAWEADPYKIFSMRPGSPESMPLALPPAKLFSVASTGELAVLLEQNILAQVPLLGGTPREILRNVYAADWSQQDGKLLVAQSTGTKRRIEFPIGKLLFESSGLGAHPRVSPKGDFIAFADPDLVVVDASGKETRFGVHAIHGLAWSPTGDEIWVVSTEEGTKDLPQRVSSALRVVNLQGEFRTIMETPARMELHDLSGNGEALFSLGTVRVECRGTPTGQTEERDFTWFDGSFAFSLSADGRMMLIREIGVAGGEQGLVYVRRTDNDSPPVLIGEGLSMALSPDGSSVLALKFGDPPVMKVLPVGQGSVRSLAPGKITKYAYRGAAFFPDGKRVLLRGMEPGHGWRLYTQNIDEGEPLPVTPDDVVDTPGLINAISPDGKLIVAVARDQNLYAYPVEGGTPNQIPGFQSEDSVIRWSADGKSLYVYNREVFPIRIYRLNISTGRRDLWKEIFPPDQAGVPWGAVVLLTADGKNYFYSYNRELNNLYLAKGLE